MKATKSVAGWNSSNRNTFRSPRSRVDCGFTVCGVGDCCWRSETLSAGVGAGFGGCWSESLGTSIGACFGGSSHSTGLAKTAKRKRIQ